MKIYEGANIRNIVVVGHAHAGKTSLVSAMLYTAGATPKLGHVDAGDTITDYEEEEIERAMTLSTGVAHAEWGKTKINLLDTPGFNIFIHEARAAMVPTEAALVVVDGAQPVGIVTGYGALPRSWMCPASWWLPAWTASVRTRTP